MVIAATLNPFNPFRSGYVAFNLGQVGQPPCSPCRARDMSYITPVPPVPIPVAAIECLALFLGHRVIRNFRKGSTVIFRCWPLAATVFGIGRCDDLKGMRSSYGDRCLQAIVCGLLGAT